MKNILDELEKRDGAICVSCGVIFEGRELSDDDCPACNQPRSLRWITRNCSYMVGMREEQANENSTS